jgi:hypothetical protein
MDYDFFIVDEEKEKKKPEIPIKESVEKLHYKTKPKTSSKRLSKSKGVKITSDKIRTGYYLITHTSARGRIEEIWDDLKDFFTRNQIEKIGGEYKIIEKENSPI